MAAVNTERWVGSIFGAGIQPMIEYLKVQAGTTTTFKQGELVYIDALTDNLTKMAATTDNLHGILIAAEEQKATDPARLVRVYIPRPGDMFRFKLTTAAAIQVGTELAAGTTTVSYELTATATDAIAWAVNVQPPQSGTTWPTITHVNAMFKQAGVGCTDFPFVGTTQGDAS